MFKLSNIAKYILKRAVKEKNKVILNLLFNFGIVFIGKLLGERYLNIFKKGALYLWNKQRKKSSKYINLTIFLF